LSESSGTVWLDAMSGVSAIANWLDRLTSGLLSKSLSAIRLLASTSVGSIADGEVLNESISCSALSTSLTVGSIADGELFSESLGSACHTLVALVTDGELLGKSVNTVVTLDLSIFARASWVLIVPSRDSAVLHVRAVSTVANALSVADLLSLDGDSLALISVVITLSEVALRVMEFLALHGDVLTEVFVTVHANGPLLVKLNSLH